MNKPVSRCYTCGKEFILDEDRIKHIKDTHIEKHLRDIEYKNPNLKEHTYAIRKLISGTY